MHQQREELDIMFRKTLPEHVLRNVRQYGNIHQSDEEQLDIYNYGFQSYDHYSRLNFPEYSPDESEIRHEYLNTVLGKNGNIFMLLNDYAEQALIDEGDEIKCRIKYILGWNEISKRLGQDLFITSWIAWNDINNVHPAPERSFVWPAVVRTDEERIHAIKNRGLAENHFHLHGSTQSFALTWACFMNHPEMIKQFFKESKVFNTNLQVNLSLGEKDNVLSWSDRIMYAAIIRALLFERVIDMSEFDKVCHKFRQFDNIAVEHKVKELVESMRRIYGVKFKQPNRKTECLDYAISNESYYVDSHQNNRLLAGERAFLYHCFKKIYAGSLTDYESMLFYLYILIKNNFRSEMIQVNNRAGFQNFSDYQDRKDIVYGKRTEYWVEMYRLAVRETIRVNNLIFLETRIMPKNVEAYIKLLDNYDDFFKEETEIEIKPHYVIHFGKTKFRSNELSASKFSMHPRNKAVRGEIKKQAQDIANYFQKNKGEQRRICGIDACSLEIGCRPETFATEFRYLRKQVNLLETNKKGGLNAVRTKLGVTYHVGEDFLDIIDALRAIEETIVFLEMESGDRLGHALALGIDAEEYYTVKRREIYLTKQDYLDNLLWILERSLEWGINIESNIRCVMQEKAEELFWYIYGDKGLERKLSFSDTMSVYKDSWQLRGDHPDLYRQGKYTEEKGLIKSAYNIYKAREKIEHLRKNENISYMYYLYHFDTEVKRKGLEPERIFIKDWYVRLVDAFQRKMRMIVADKGICIECNPTSNVLIGTFKRYDRHPILKFTDYYLNNDSKEPQIKASINTDDLGVFDTSLENEYALLYCAIRRMRHQKENFNDEAIFAYLEHLRMNGVEMAFR